MLPLAGMLLAFGLMLVLVSLLPGVAKRMGIPLTVLLAVAGIGLGLLLHGPDTAELPEAIRVIREGLMHLPQNADLFIYIFLPVLLFEASLNLDLRALLRDWAPVLLLAIVAVLLCSLSVGGLVSALSAQPLAVCLLLGAIVATTDPIAVIAIFRDLGAPERLRLLVEGESLLNDAAAIALFTVVLTMVGTPQLSDGAVAAGIGLFLVSFLGGLAVGLAIGRAACQLLLVLRRQPTSEIALTLGAPYVTFVVANDVFHVSGVVAVVAAGLVVGTLGRSSFSQRSWQQLQTVWNQLGFLASTLIFLLAATVVPPLLRDAPPPGQLVLLVGATVLATLLSRALVLYLLLPALSLTRLSAPVSAGHRAVMWWGGLRGAVSIALALAVTVRPELDSGQKSFIASLGVLYVLVSLGLHGLTLKPLMRLLGIDRLPAEEQALRDRALALELTGVERRLSDMAVLHGWTSALPSLERLQNTPEPLALSPEELRAVGLLAVTQREQRMVRSYQESGVLSTRSVQKLVGQAALLDEAARMGGLPAYRDSAGRALRFTLGFRLALTIQRRFGWRRWLEEALHNRAVLLLFTELLCRNLRQYVNGRLEEVFDPATAADLDAILQQRLAATEEASAALRLLYPQFMLELEGRILRRAGLRLEERSIDTLLEDALVSQDIHNRLRDELVQRQRGLDGRLQLHLGLALETMLQGVPLLGALSREQLAQVARVLRPRFAMPGEDIVRAGESGRDMFFIAIGQVSVLSESGTALATLQAGDFFGELALLSARPRTATVRAAGYCHLLQLRRRDFQRLMSGSEAFRQAILAVAKSRQEEAGAAA